MVAASRADIRPSISLTTAISEPEGTHANSIPGGPHVEWTRRHLRLPEDVSERGTAWIAGHGNWLATRPPAGAVEYVIEAFCVRVNEASPKNCAPIRLLFTAPDELGIAARAYGDTGFEAR